MWKSLQSTFLIQAVIAFFVGLPLLAAPGVFLGALGWAPVDPILSRILGSALLALAWACLRGWQSPTQGQAATLAQSGAIFCVLSALGILRHLLTGAGYPLLVWLILAGFTILAIAWIALALRTPPPRAH